jgi:hypothetical protein
MVCDDPRVITRHYLRPGGNLRLREEPAPQASIDLECDTGRLFMQMQYGRRDIARRIRPTDRVNHLSEAAIGRATTERELTVVGLHPAGFFDG